MRPSKELTKIIADVQNIVSHEDDVLGYKVIVKNSEVQEALEDLGYVLDYKQGSKTEKMFYRLSANEKDVLEHKAIVEDHKVGETSEDLGIKLDLKKVRSVRDILGNLKIWFDYKEKSKTEKRLYELPTNPTQAKTPADIDSMLNEIGGYIISRREEENYFANPIKKVDAKKVEKDAKDLENKVKDAAVKPADETTEVIPAPKGRSTWAYWGIGLITAAVALRFLYNACIPATPERSPQETVPAIVYSALSEECDRLGGDLSQCTRSLNAARYDPKGQTTSAIVDQVKSHIDGNKEDLYLGPGCENAANELYARLHGVNGGEATFRRALESSWKVCDELVQSPAKVIHYKK